MGEKVLVMFKQYGSNMNPIDGYTRVFVATIILIYAIQSGFLLLSIISVMLYFTAYTKFCFFYYFLKINERYSIKNYYLSLLPRYRKTPVFIFDASGKILFKNNASEDTLSHVKTVLDIGMKSYRDIIDQELTESRTFQWSDKYYQIELQGIKKEKFLLAYFNDITEIMKLNDAIEETQREVIYAMGEIGETRSKETGNHVKRVALYSKELALLYGLTDKEADLLQMASPMHDIGKVGIPDAILNAPRRLEVSEWNIMQTHAHLGYTMLKSSNKQILQAAAIVAHEHHEKWDGSGYPRAISGESIHIYGRITALADVFDALGSERVYKKAWKLDDILKFFVDEKGKHFEPKLVDLFIENLDIFLEIRDRYMDVEE